MNGLNLSTSRPTLFYESTLDQWFTQDLAKGGLHPQPQEAKGSGGVTPAAKEFLWFSHKKTLILAHFFI